MLKEFFEILSKQGVVKVELSGGKHVNSSLERLLLYYKNERGFDYQIHNYFPPPGKPFILNIASVDEGLRERSVEFAKNSIKLANIIGCEQYTMHPGYLCDLQLSKNGESFEPVSNTLSSVERAWKQLEKSVFELCNFAESYGVTFGLENLFPNKDINYSILCTYLEIENIFDKFYKYDNLGLLFDLGHAQIAGNIMDFDTQEFADLVSKNFNKKIVGYHISANNGIEDQHLLPRHNDWMTKFVYNNANDKPVTIEARNSKLENIISYYYKLQV